MVIEGCRLKLTLRWMINVIPVAALQAINEGWKCLNRLKVGLVLTLCISCTPSGQTSEARPDKLATTDNYESQKNKPSSQDVISLCSRVQEIKVLPFKDEHVDDPAYNTLIQAGEAVIPCLIDKVTDTSVMPDPRQTPKSHDVRVGDVAYFILMRTTNLGFVELLPAEVQEDYRNDGVSAYFEYVKKKEHRKSLQNKLNEWYYQKYGTKPQKT